MTTVDRVGRLAAELWQELGYDGCRELREALRDRMADHRAQVAEERRAAGLARPRSSRKPTSHAQAAAATSLMVGFVSETAIYRMRAIQRYAPHLEDEINAGRLKVWPAYLQAIAARDAAAVASLTAG